jgi:hypothetical protein
LFQIAERLKDITDELPKDVQEEMKLAFVMLFQKTSVFTISRENIQAICANILVKHNTHFPSGWHQIAFIYYGEITIVLKCDGEWGGGGCGGWRGQSMQFHFPSLHAPDFLVKWETMAVA